MTRASPPEPVFEAPWHAQVFALTVGLNEAGMFAWPDWTKRFSATLARHGQGRDLNGGEDYFIAWLETLELFLSDLGHTGPEEVTRLRDAWRAAYLSTPHGEPVRLAVGQVDC